MSEDRLTVFDGSVGSRTLPLGGPRFFGRTGSGARPSLICLLYGRTVKVCWQKRHDIRAGV